MLLAAWSVSGPARSAEFDAAQQFQQQVQPILETYCYNCHGYGAGEAGVVLDEFASDAALIDPELWFRVLKQLRAGIMPPDGEPRPEPDELEIIQHWIKTGPFGIDPQNPDPGHVTVRRLNRTEYRNTIRDLIGVDFDTVGFFPPDDTGHGFDNIGDVLTMSPLMMEKYIAAAKSIVGQVVPTSGGAPRETHIAGRRFRTSDADEPGDGRLDLSYYMPATASYTWNVKHAGQYQLVLELQANERHVDGRSDYNKCRLVFSVDGEQVLDREFTRQGGTSYSFDVDRDWSAAAHRLELQVEPLTPDEEQVRSLSLAINGLTFRGPMAPEHWVRPKNYERFFPRPVPDDAAERREYARELLGRFATRAFRNPADAETVDRLVALAERYSAQPGNEFEGGVAQAMTAVLASPQFLFREERAVPSPDGSFPLVDEYSLASRLSYFLWSTMPDERLFRLASEGKLRADLASEIDRMLDDDRSQQFFRNFVGQWLQTRAIESIPINAAAVIRRDSPPDREANRVRRRFRQLSRKEPEELTEEEKQELEDVQRRFFASFRRFRRFELNGEIRRDMRRETEMLFEFIIREDRNLLELIDGDYTFLNERLANYYGIDGVEVEGDYMRPIQLPAESQRGGVLTQGTVLAVTSNPNRTSPVKRGLFILENILGTPPAPPPPNVPSLEDGEDGDAARLTMRESLVRHREDPLCFSCHNRMDPLGLALENYNALGLFRDTERGQPVDASGMLITGESFADVRELKKILAGPRRRDFFRCLTEKLLMYATGRSLDYHDTHTVDTIVADVEQTGGRASALLDGVIRSAAFQRCRPLDNSDVLQTSQHEIRPQAAGAEHANPS